MQTLQILKWCILLLEQCMALPIIYLCVLAISATRAAKKRRGNMIGSTLIFSHLRFAILIPAHNEEALLAGLLNSLATLAYPKDRFTVYVIADNCTDRTAALARATGWVQVYERSHATRQGKGYVISWMLQQLEAAQAIYDAYIILDADSKVAPTFLRAMEQELVQGSQVLHAHNVVMNATESASTALRWLALTLIAHVRPLGRNAIGGSSTIGNGVCLSRAVLLRYAWQAFSLTEDYEYYLSLVQDGIRVHYVPEAIVYTHMPTTFTQMRSQDIRWESSVGRPATWRIAVKLLRDGIRFADIIRLEALAELLTPPLSLLACSCISTGVVSLLLWFPPGLLLSVVLSIALSYYVSTAFYLVRPPSSIYKALLHAPSFMLWKLWVYLVLSRSKKHTTQWVRTSRPA